MPLWQLYVDDLPEDLLTSTDLQIVLETFISHPSGRSLIKGAVSMVRDSDTPKR